MLQKLPVNNFDRTEDTLQFDKYCVKNYNEEGDERYFLEVDVQYLEKLHERHSYLLFLPETMIIEKVDELIANLHDKTDMLYT